MDEHDATEQAYKNGYAKGYVDGQAGRKKTAKPRKRKHKEISQEALNALDKIGQQTHGKD